MRSAWMLPDPYRYAVIGSAPSLENFDYGRLRDRRVIAANGAVGPLSLRHHTIDILCTTTHLFRDDATPQERETQSTVQSITVRDVYVDMKNSPEKFPQAAWIAREKRIRVYPDAREEIVLKVMNSRPSRHASSFLRVSTGVWAVCLAVASGSPSVLVAGIDPDSQGHAGIDDGVEGPPRDHVTEDKAVLGALESAGVVEVVRCE